jgi:hypothetical protein
VHHIKTHAKRYPRISIISPEAKIYCNALLLVTPFAAEVWEGDERIGK